MFGFLAQFWILRRRMGGIHGRALLLSVIQILAASTVMGVAVVATSGGIHAWMGATRLARLVDLAISIPVGAVAFYAACRAMKVAELEMAGSALVSPVRGWLSRQRDRI